jgi:adenosylcobyric acid synthase
VAVLRLPHIANFTDLDALERHGVDLHYLARPRELSAYDLVILPGTKNTRGDLRWLRRQGWDRHLAECDRAGGRILGLCGGYQMMGESIDDPEGVEGPPGSSEGLGLLAARTVMTATKRTTRSEGVLVGDSQVPVSGYEIHVGRTEVDAARSGGAVVRIHRRGGGDLPQPEEDGLWSADGRHGGTYVHGLFDEPQAARALLRRVRPDLDWSGGPQESAWTYRQRQYDRLAELLEQSLDRERLFALIDPERLRDRSLLR